MVPMNNTHKKNSGETEKEIDRRIWEPYHHWSKKIGIRKKASFKLDININMCLYNHQMELEF